MMIEKIVIESSADDGSIMTISGRSLEYLHGPTNCMGDETVAYKLA